MKIGKLKYDNVYLLNGMSDNFQYKFLRNVLDHDKKDDEHIAKVLSLTNELQDNRTKEK